MGLYNEKAKCWVLSCESMDTRRYLNGWCCEEHTPARLAGKEENTPPDYHLVPLLRSGGSMVDYRAVREQKKRSRIEAKRANKALGV